MKREGLLIPLGCYWAVTLGLPALHGASGFSSHAAWVVAVSLPTVFCVGSLALLGARKKP